MCGKNIFGIDINGDGKDDLLDDLIMMDILEGEEGDGNGDEEND